MSKPNSNYSPEFRARAVRMLLEQQGEHRSEWAALQAIASKLGCTGETLRKWVRQSEQTSQSGIELTSKERERLKALERENLELRLTQSFCLFCPGGTRPPTKEMIRFIDDHRADYGVESLCQQLPLSASSLHVLLA